MDSDVEIDLELERKVDKATQSTPPTPNKQHALSPTSSQANLLPLPANSKPKEKHPSYDKLDREHKRRQKSKQKQPQERSSMQQRDSMVTLHPATMAEATTQTLPHSSEEDELKQLEQKPEEQQKEQQKEQQGNLTKTDTKN